METVGILSSWFSQYYQVIVDVLSFLILILVWFNYIYWRGNINLDGYKVIAPRILVRSYWDISLLITSVVVLCISIVFLMQNNVSVFIGTRLFIQSFLFLLLAKKDLYRYQAIPDAAFSEINLAEKESGKVVDSFDYTTYLMNTEYHYGPKHLFILTVAQLLLTIFSRFLI